MAPSSRFWDRIAARYARRPVADEAAYQKKLKITRSYFRPDSEVFEFGCGTGSTAIAHAPYVGHIRAVDISPKMLAIAQVKAEASGLANITFEEAAIDDLDVPDGSYDVVLGMSILHLVEDRAAVIGKVHRMLKPRGVFVSSTACLGDGMKYIKLIAPAARFVGLMPYVDVFTAKQLVAEMTGAGFAIERQWQPGKGKALFMVARKRG